MCASKRATLALLATLSVAGGASVSAHRLDEFLQAARIAIEPGRVQLEMNLAPGTAVADGVIGEIDTDRNGVLSHEEQRAYAGRVLNALTLRVDDSAVLQLRPVASTFPDLAALRAGDGAISMRVEADVAPLPVGPHRLFFRNQHAPANSVYLANALVPEDAGVAVTGQERTGDQSELTIAFTVHDTAASSLRWLWLGLVGAGVISVPLIRRRRDTTTSYRPSES